MVTSRVHVLCVCVMCALCVCVAGTAPTHPPSCLEPARRRAGCGCSAPSCSAGPAHRQEQPPGPNAILAREPQLVFYPSRLTLELTL